MRELQTKARDLGESRGPCRGVHGRARVQSGGVSWREGGGGEKKVMVELCAVTGLMRLLSQARHLAAAQTVTVGTVNSSTSCPRESHHIIYALIIAPDKPGELKKKIKA